MLHSNDDTKRRNIPFPKDRSGLELEGIIDCVRKCLSKGRPTMQAGPLSMKTRNETEGCLSCESIKAAGTIKNS